LALTAFGHVGVFPEQAENWEFITKRVQGFGEPCNVLNLFAYTGGATLAAAKAGAQVTHVDSIRQTVNWANQNVQQNRLDGVRWMIEDAVKFVSRELRRQNRYQGIILDPPAYGRGPAGEKWIFDEHMESLTQMCLELLVPDGFCIINIYSMGHSPLVLHNMVKHYKPDLVPQYGELVIASQTGQLLPLSAFLRF
jgi:23S rRNA (cytosine1962-C5)-methyltransferase